MAGLLSCRRRWTLLLGSALLLALGFLAGTYFAALGQTGPGILLEGDVPEPRRVSPGQETDRVTVSVGERTYRAYPLKDVIGASRRSRVDSVAVSGAGGSQAVLSEGQLDEAWLTWSQSEGWRLISPAYPESLWIGDVGEISVRGDGGASLGVIAWGANYPALTPGEAAAAGHRIRVVPHESAGEAAIGVYRRERVLTLAGALEMAGAEARGREHLAVGRDGRFESVSVDDLLVIGADGFYLPGAGDTALAGVILDPPERIITDLHDQVLSLAGGGQRVMVIIIDGLGYQLYQEALRDDLAPTVTSGRAEKALSVLPPITNVAVAAMMTGRTPDATGVAQRGDRQPLVPTLLETLSDLGLKGAFVGGSIGFLELGGEMVLSLEGDHDSVDEAVYQNAREYAERDYDVLIVHFKDVDNLAHRHGPRAPQVREHLSRVDGYVEELFGEWDGPRIILSDHGLHRTPEGGHHGELRFEDMFVPYIRFD